MSAELLNIESGIPVLIFTPDGLPPLPEGRRVDEEIVEEEDE